MAKLREWSKENFGNVTKDIERLCAELATLELDHVDQVVLQNKMN